MKLSALRANPWVTLGVLVSGLFMNLLDTTIVYVATPSMLAGLHASLDQVLWVFNGFLLAYAVLLIPAGRLGDVFGPKRISMVGIALFTLASAACGLSQDTTQLIAARVLQGVGGALLSPQILPFITTLFRPDRRGAAFGLNGAVVGLATVAGPTLGGLIVTYADWRWIFFLNVPVGVAALVATALLVPDLRPGRSHSFDPAGIVLVGTGLLAVTFGLVEGQRYQWGTVAAGVTIPELIAGGLALLVAFAAWEARQPEPLVPLRLFRNLDFAVNNWIGVAMAFGMQAAFIPLTILTQSVLGMTALQSGLTFAPMSLTAGVVAPFAGRLTDRVGGRRLLVAGLALFAVGIGLAAWTAGTSSTMASLLLPLVVAGLGMGLTFAPSLTIAMRRVAPADAGSASGVINTTRQAGSAMGAAVVGAVLQQQLAVHLPAEAAAKAAALPAAARASFVDGFRHAVAGGLELAGGASGQTGSGSMHALAAQVFDAAFLLALRPAVAAGVAVVLLGSASALLLERRWRMAVPAAAEPAEIAA